MGADGGEQELSAAGWMRYSFRLSPEQQAFVDAYLANGGNGTKAYLIAYPECTRESARRLASELLKNPDISLTLSEAKRGAVKRMLGRFEVTAESWLAVQAAMAFFNPTDILSYDGRSLTLKPTTEIPPEALVAIKSVEVAEGKLKVQFVDRQSAMDALGRYLGLFKDRSEVTLDVSRTLADQLGAAQARLAAAVPEGSAHG